MSTEGKCPVMHGFKGRSNRDWWPDQVDLDILHQHSPASNPLGADFDYEPYIGWDLIPEAI